MRLRIPVLAILLLLATVIRTHAALAGPSISISVNGDPGSPFLARVEVRGTERVTAKDARSPDGRHSAMTILDARGMALAHLRVEHARKREPDLSPIRVVGPSGRVIAPGEAAYLEVKPDSSPELGTQSVANSLSWSGVEGDRLYVAASHGVAIDWVAALIPENEKSLRTTGPIPAGDRPLAFELLPGQPNPFSESTRLRFTLPHPGHVTISVFDVTGRRMAKILDEAREAGSHFIEYRPAQLPRGHYFVRLTIQNASGIITRTASRPIVHLR